MKKIYVLCLIFLSIMGIYQANAQTTLFSQNFAGAVLPPGWTNSGTGGTWSFYTMPNLSGVTIGTTTRANGYAVFNSDTLGNDGIAENVDLITSSFSCAGQPTVYLTFQDIFAQYATSTGTVAVSVNNGAWQTVYTVGPGIAQNAINANPNFANVNISAIAGNQANVRLRFKYQGDWDYWWVVDDILVYAPVAFDAAITDGNIAPYTAVPLAHVTPYIPSCVVLNNGGNTITGVSVATTITRNSTNTVVYNATMTQASLASGLSTTLTASSSFTPTAVDFYLVEFIVSITQADAVALNDTFVTAISVEDSLYARDFFLLTGNTAGLDGPWFLGAATAGQLGNVFRAQVNTTLVSAVATFSGSFAIGDQTQANLYSMTGNVPGALIASSPVLTVTAADTPVVFREFFFPAGTNLTAGTNYLITVQQNAASAARFGLYSALDIYTPNTSFIKIGTAAWQDINTAGIGEQTFMIRANLYNAPVCAITDVAPGTQTACVPATNRYTQQVIVTYTTPPATGMLNVNGQTFAITSSPQTVTLTNLIANGLAVNVTAFFAANTACTYTENTVFTAPASCATTCAITALSAGTQTACVPATNTYTQQVTVTYTTPPATGTLNVNGQTFAITSSPQTVTLTNLTANGLAVNVTAAFSANTACNFNQNTLFTAPANCQAVCTISDVAPGTQTACVNTTNNYTQQVIVTYSTPPATGMLNVNGQTFAITSSPQTVTLTNLTSNGLAVNVTAAFTANTACNYTENSVFTAPASCLCPTITVNVNTTNNTNCSSPNGSATAVVTGGGAIVSYAWTPSTFGSGQTITSLPSGSYSVTVMNGAGCTGTGTGNVSNSAGVNAVVGTISNPTCNSGANGQISITATGGTAPITYTWSDQGVATNISSRSNLAAGSYTVVVSDAGGCSVNLGPILLTAPAALTAVLTGSTNVLCNGGTNGTIDMTVSGGTLPYAHSWTNSASTSADLSGLGAGTYQLSVVDFNNCPVVTGPQVTITEPAAISIGLVGTINASCNGLSDGTANVTVSGGTPGFTYNWGAGNSTTEDLSNAAAGSYQLVVTDLNLCTQTGPTVTIGQPTVITLSVSSSDESTSGANDGTATVVASGGTPPYGTYQWNDANAQTSATASSLSAGTYSVVVTDANGCSQIASVVVDLGNGIRNLDLNKFQVYPNPATKEVVISFEGTISTDYQVTIYTTIGDKIFKDRTVQTQNYSKTVDVSSFAAGVYFIEVSTEAGKTVKKLTVTK